MPIKRSQSGATLVELMVIMAIISVMFGMSSAFLSHAGQKYIFSNAVKNIVSLIKYGQAYSKEENSFAEIRISPQYKNIQLWGGKMIRYWNMENVPQNTSVVGRIGNGYSCNGLSGLDTKDELQKLTKNGNFCISFWVFPRRPKVLQVQILWKAGAYFQVGLDKNFCPFATSSSRTINSKESLPLYQWSLIQFRQESNKMILSHGTTNHDSIKAQQDCQLVPIKNKLPIEFGTNFTGYIDEARFIVPQLRSNVTLEETIDITSSVQTIHIASNGQLDCQYHNSNVIIQCNEQETKRKSTITLSTIGHCKLQEFP